MLNAAGVPLLSDVAPEPSPVAPGLSGGALVLEDSGRVLVAPTATGRPLPTPVLASLTRDGKDVRVKVDAVRIPMAAPATLRSGRPPRMSRRRPS